VTTSPPAAVPLDGVARNGPAVATDVQVRPATAAPDVAQRDVTIALPGVPWLTREVALYAGMVLLALVLRLIGLGDKPLHHDESLHATYSWYLYQGRGYQYDPMMHGPFQFLITAFIFFLTGASNFTARLLPAIVGSALVGLPWFLRRELGRPGALILAAMLMVSPSFLYFSRFERNDIYIAFFTLGIVITFFRFLERPRGFWIVAMGTLWAFSFTAKENTYITAFIFVAFVCGVLAWELLSRAPKLATHGAGPALSGRPLIDGVRSVGADPFLLGLAGFGLVFTLFFTTLFSHPSGLIDGFTKSIQYWLSQQPVARGSQPWYYYVVIAPAYEPLAILFGLAGIGLALRRRTYWSLFLVWFAAGALFLYSWAGEKMPWLILHPLLPFFLLAAWTLNWVWEHRAVPMAQVALVVAGVLSVSMVHSAALLSYMNAANPVEFLVYTQTSTDVLDVVDQVNAVARRSGQGENMPMVIDANDSWPFVWYLRDYKAVAYTGSIVGPQTAPVVMVSTDLNGQVAPLMSDYVVQRYKLRVWWVPEPLNQSDGRAWLRWLFYREPWNRLGSYDFFLYIRHDLAEGP
jgi:uncharacterized protein (TIGR03663 family)